MSAHAHCASPQSTPHRHISLKPGAREHAQPVSPTHAGSHVHSRRIDTHSETSHATHSHSPAHTPQRGVSRRSHGIISSIIPARARPRGPPNSPRPLGAPRATPELANLDAAGSRERVASLLTSPRAQRLAGRTARRASSGAAAPATAATATAAASYGATPRGRGGPPLPTTARAATLGGCRTRPMAERGRAARLGAWAGRRAPGLRF